MNILTSSGLVLGCMYIGLAASSVVDSMPALSVVVVVVVVCWSTCIVVILSKRHSSTQYVVFDFLSFNVSALDQPTVYFTIKYPIGNGKAKRKLNNYEFTILMPKRNEFFTTFAENVIGH